MYYVSKATAKGVTVAYTVCNRVGGMESEETRCTISPALTDAQAKAAAEARRDELNKRTK